MKKWLLLPVAFLMAGIPAGAVQVCANYAGSDVTTIGACTVGPLVFSNFTVTGGLNMNGAMVGLSTPTYDSGTGTYFLTFTTNFNLINPTTYRDVIFGYQVSGPVSAIDGAMGGTGNRVIAETICGTPFSQTACASASVLGTLVLDADHTTGLTTLSGTSGAYHILKDISLAPGATLSDFTQSYHVPEPAALALVGSGLAALCLLRRRRKA